MTHISPLKRKALNEAYEKETRYIKIVETYRSNPNISAVTGKFYSSHDAVDLTEAKDEFLDVILKLRKDLKDKISKPDTTNHTYGWYSKPLVQRDVNDKRFFHPLCSNDNTKHMLKLAFDKSMKRPKFGGVPFKL